MKLENFLFSHTGPDSELMMIDFGLSKHFKSGEVQHEAVRTPYRVAPEVLRGGYNERCNVWAVGVLAYCYPWSSDYVQCNGRQLLVVNTGDWGRVLANPNKGITKNMLCARADGTDS